MLKRTTKLSALLLALVMVLSVVLAVPNMAYAADGDFDDVGEDHTFYAFVNYAKDKKYVDGYGDGNYGPDDQMTRAQVAKLLVNAKGLPVNKNAKNTGAFKDTDGHALEPWIAASKGVIFDGYKGNFSPEDKILRGQAAKVVVNTLDLKLREGKDADFEDVPAGHEFEEYIAILSSQGIVSGYQDKFSPEAPLTRGAFAKYVANAATIPAALDAVEKALETGKQDNIDEARVLINALPDADVAAELNVVLASRVDVESILLSHTELTLTEGENISLSATVLPENATNKNLLWSSSDENVATVNEHGVVQANSAGVATITVTDTLGDVTNDVIVTVKKLTIDSIEDITTHITQYDTYALPTTVTALMSNGTTQEYTIDWLDDNVDTSILGNQYFEGTVEGYEQSITLTLVVKEYEPQILTNSYSSVTINNVSKGLSLRIYNNGTKPVNIEKIEIYEKGRLYTTYTPQSLIESGISTVVQPTEAWGISISFKLGIWLDNSYVKYYVSANNTYYEYEDNLDKN